MHRIVLITDNTHIARIDLQEHYIILDHKKENEYLVVQKGRTVLSELIIVTQERWFHGCKRFDDLVDYRYWIGNWEEIDDLRMTAEIYLRRFTIDEKDIPSWLFRA